MLGKYKQMALLHNKRIIQHSFDWETCILLRKSSQIVRRYNAWGITMSLLDDIVKKGCKLLIVKVDGKARYKINPRKWLENGVKDRLTKKQELHCFLPVENFERIGVSK